MITGLPKKASFAVQVFPNPAREKVNVVASNAGAQADISILSLQGEKIRQWADSGARSEANLDLSGIAPGSYLIRIKTSEGIQIREEYVERLTYGQRKL
jgi:hypothetical protein